MTTRAHLPPGRLAAALLAGAMAMAPGGAALAHEMNLSHARVEVSGGGIVTVEVSVKGADADRFAGTAVFDRSADHVRPDALAASAAPIGAYVAAHAVVLADGAPCRAGTPDVSSDGDGVVVRIGWSCPGRAARLVYRSTVLTDMDAAAREVVLIRTGDGTSQALLDARESEVALAGGEARSLAQVIGRYLVAGIEHIFLGYDHIAFLVAVVLWARRLWPVVKIVTAFTVAHSITLTLATLELVRIPAAIVEPAIAASIVFVALENFVSRDVDGRWRYTFAFGLIHGFGFADALQHFGLPRDALIEALASFNIGVEMGQVAIVSIVLPLLLLLDRVLAPSTAPVPVRLASTVYMASAAIGLLGGYWFLDRTVFA